MPSATPPSRRIQIHKRHPGLELSRPRVRNLFRTLDRSGLFAVPTGDLSIAFLPDAAMGELHAAFLQDPAPTDVITFPGDPAFGFAGEICVCPDAAAAQAERRGLSLSRELTLYLIHGYLHLAGFDDTTPASRKQMRRAEKKAMNLIETQNQFPTFYLPRTDLPE